MKIMQERKRRKKGESERRKKLFLKDKYAANFPEACGFKFSKRMSVRQSHLFIEHSLL